MALSVPAKAEIISFTSWGCLDAVAGQSPVWEGEEVSTMLGVIMDWLL